MAIYKPIWLTLDEEQQRRIADGVDALTRQLAATAERAAALAAENEQLRAENAELRRCLDRWAAHHPVPRLERSGVPTNS
ncbi:MAG: hypothetical protein HY875_17190 [Chloroflexi bacterium]|nr:hypothetical protein [Chloroflexota bacterium]